MPITTVIHVEDNLDVAQSVKNMIRFSDKLSDSNLIQVGTLQEALSLLDGGTISDSPDTCFVLDGNFPSNSGEAPTFNGSTLATTIRTRLSRVLIVGFAANDMDKGTIPELDGSAQKPNIGAFITTLEELSSRS